MEKIFEGLKAFRKDVYPSQRSLFEKLAEGQSPEVLFLSCSDSRVDPNLLTNTAPGELFVLRNAGNIVPPYGAHPGGMTASVEFGVGALKVKHIIVCGHRDCGAMKAALKPEGLEKFPVTREWLTHTEAAVKVVQRGECDEYTQLERLIRENVILQMQHLATHPYVAAALRHGELDMHGWVYDFATGHVEAYDEETGDFHIITEE